MVTRRNATAENPPGEPPSGEDDATPGTWGVPVSGRGTNPIDAIDDADEAETDAVVGRFVAALSSPSADRMRIKVYKANESSGKLDYCRDMMPAQFQASDTFERIREEWGAGEFEFRLIGDQGIVRRIRQSIANPIGRGTASPTPAPQNEGIAQALAMLAQSQTAILQALQQRPDPQVAMMQSMQMMKMMREIVAPAAAPPAPTVDPMTMFSQVVGMIRESKKTIQEFTEDEREEKDPLAATLPKLVEAASALVLQNNRAPQVAAPVQLPASVTHNRATDATPAAPVAPVESVPAIDSNAIDMNDPAMLMIRGAIEDLIDMAKRGESPEKGGEYIADKVPDELLDYMDNRYWFEVVVQLFPALREHETWVRAAKAHADTLFAADDGGDDSTPTP